MNSRDIRSVYNTFMIVVGIVVLSWIACGFLQQRRMDQIEMKKWDYVKECG